MGCPYCHGELEAGTHISSRGSYWLPKGMRWGADNHRAENPRGGRLSCGASQDLVWGRGLVLPDLRPSDHLWRKI